MSKKVKKQKTVAELLEEALIPEQEQFNQLKGNWSWVKLGSICDINMGQSPKGEYTSENSEGVPLIGGPADMGDIYPSVKRYTSKPTKLSKVGELIISVRATLGKTNISNGVYCLGRGVAGISSNIVDVKLLRYYFKIIEDYLYKISTGTTFSQISRKNIEELPFPLAPAKEQNEILNKVERLLNKIDEAKQLIDEAKETFEFRRAAILDKAFRGELLKNNIKKKHVKINSQVSLDVPDHWEVRALKDIVANYNNQRIPVSQKKREEMQGDIPYYGATGIVDFVNGFTHDGEFVLVGEDGANLLSRSKPQAFIVKGKSWVNNHAHVLSMNGDGCNYFLMQYLNYLPLNDYVTGSAQPKLNRRNLDSILMVLPPPNEQREISNKINHLFSLEKDALLLFGLGQYDLLKQSILSKAFRGELGTNDPTEESAIELLKEVLQEQVK